MFSANPSISSTRLKPLDVVERRGNGVGLEGERGQTGGETGSDSRGNGVRLGEKHGRIEEGTGSDWGKRGRIGGIGLGYKRRGQLIWLNSLPLTAPRPPNSN